ncbi:MAG: cellulose biosynthesis cyclic di-GMP-binding regulatory protein BcsB [Anaerolineales bacterium]|nr:cellulose biosynthesis cyclic di-GMP-binding regulatory protein BcsB [Anaerolineales bacterium]
MNQRFLKLFLILALCTSLLFGLTDSIKAQGIQFFKTAISEQKPFSQTPDPSVVTWEMLELGETHLVGPDDAIYFSFMLPATWKLIEGASLNLSLGVAVTAGIQDQSDSTANNQDQIPAGFIGAGTLTVMINDTALAILPLDQVGEVVKTIPIPVDAFSSANIDGLVEVGLILNTGTSCYNFDQMNVVVRTSSYFTLPHNSTQPATNLVSFPYPIFQNSFIPDSVLLVIPDQPSAAELQAALTVASGLGKLGDGSLVFDMVTLGKLTTELKTASHLIFIGNSASLPVMEQFQLTLPISEGQFQVLDGSVDDGFVEMVSSPWNNSNVILIVSGNTDQGTIKAAQAVSTGVFQPNQSPNLAVVNEVKTTPVLVPQPTDQTLTAMGYKGRLFESRGVRSVAYNFNVPPGWIAASDSSFELVFGHSALLDYASSGIVIVLNGNPIGSVRLSDSSASISTNKVLINIPVSAVVPGNNRLEVRVNLEPQDVCSPQNMRGVWLNIWPDSTLHLPLDLALINPSASLGLASYPAPFTYYPLLDNTAFVLMHNDLESWRAAVKIAAFLGTTAKGPITALNVYYGDNLPEAERSKYNLLVIGRPSQLPIIGEINKDLPISFLDGSDVLADGNFQVTYRIPPDAPIGYVEILPSPWNPDNVILAVLGNTVQGLSWATSALIDSNLRSQLAGNFAMINDKQIITTDTRLSPAINSAPTPISEVAVIPPNVDENSPSPVVRESTWVLPVFVASIILIILISAVVTIGSWLRNRTRGVVQGEGHQPGKHGYFSSIKKWLAAFFEKAKNSQKDK